MATDHLHNEVFAEHSLSGTSIAAAARSHRSSGLARGFVCALRVAGACSGLSLGWNVEVVKNIISLQTENADSAEQGALRKPLCLVLANVLPINSPIPLVSPTAQRNGKITTNVF